MNINFVNFKRFKKYLSMLTIIFIVTIFFLLYSCTNKLNNSNNIPDNTSSQEDYFNDRLIVGYEDENKIQDILNFLDGEIILHVPELNAISVKIKQDAYDVIDKLSKMDDLSKYGIRYIELSYKRYLEPVYKSKEPEVSLFKELIGISPFEYANYTGESLDFYLWNHRTVNIKNAWSQNLFGDDIVVAVLDAGVDGTNPDLQGQIIEGYRPLYDSIIPPNSDSSYGGSHGTHVAGIIAAKKDGKGVVGVAPKAKIMPIVIFDDGGKYIGDEYTAKGIIWAVDNGAKVLSNSWGGPGYSQILKDAFDYALEKGVTVVVAAGNSTSSQTFLYPANYPGIIQVAAAEFNGGNVKTAYFSNGSPMITVAAPGRDILSTMPQVGSNGYDSDSFICDENGGYYGFMSGTSMATPYVSGFVALLLQKYPNAKPWQIRKIIQSSALDIDEPGIDERSGYGLVQAKAVIEEIPTTGGTDFVVHVTDYFGSWNIQSAFVSLVGTSTDNRQVRYFAKTNKDGLAKFVSIDSGVYDIFVGGPDSFESSAGLTVQCLRKAEERQYNFKNFSLNDSSTLSVRFSSSASITLENKPENMKLVFQDMLKPSTDTTAYTYVDFSSVDSYDFSKMSGKYYIKAEISQPAMNDINLNGTITINGFKIPIFGTITKGSTNTILRDKAGNYWTVFGNE
ncbi:MAG: S8 family peptidase [Fervidobacterium nodosum]